MTTRREFLTSTAAGLASLPIAACSAGTSPQSPGSGGTRPLTGNSRALLLKNPDHPQPSTLDRLPVEWNKERAKILQQKVGARGVTLLWLTDPLNVQYFTGLFATNTERPSGAFIPVKDLRLHFYYPGLDRDLVDSWWHDEVEYYFDYKHADGAFPNKGEVHIGPPVDLQRWMLQSMGKKGFDNAVIGVDRALTVKGLARYQAILPRATFVEIDDECMGMRLVKTPEEIALTQRAVNFGGLGHAFARDYLLTHGTDCTDWELQCVTQQFVMDEIMKEVKRDGKPHTAVGCGVEVLMRTGVGTAYPHPNQFHHNKVRKGDALQIIVIPLIGGYNGEQYRAFQIAPSDAHRDKVWDVHTESCMIQARESKAGVRCQDVAKAVHDFQVKSGMAKYVYHRAAHGQGIEGHQPPYIALGEETVLVEGMMFSNEPGLYDPENGFGYNHSDNVLVTSAKGVQQGTAPMTREWCFITL